MSIKAKLLIGGITLAIIPLIISSFITKWVATDEGALAIQEQAQQRLIAIRDMKKGEIEHYFANISKQVLTLANDRMIIDAMPRFTEGFHSFQRESGLNGDRALRESLASYYRQGFAGHFSEVNPGNSVDTSPLLQALSEEGIALQYQYIKANPSPLGNKHKLDSASDSSTYSALHGLYHPHIRDFLEKFGYYDIFLVDSKGGEVVYSVFKELDFATSLLNGAYADSGLGKVFKAANQLPAGAYALEDFAPYLPSYNLAASFIATPIFDGSTRMGVLIFQMPVDEINRIMTLDGMWSDMGLGESGEVYLIGPDQTMRSMSRFLLEDPKSYIETLEKSGYDREAVSQIEANGTSIGLQKIHNDSSIQAVAGNKGVHVIDDYRGVPVVSAYSPLSIQGLQWGILAEIDKTEAFHAVSNLSSVITKSAFMVMVVMAFIAGGLAFYFAMKIVKPVTYLATAIDEIERDSDLTRRIELNSNDELGGISNALNRMLIKFHDIIEELSTSAVQVSSSSTELTHITSESSQSLQQQLLETNQVATAMNQMSSTVAEVANNTADAVGAAEEANKAADEGQNVVRLTVNAIESLANEVEKGANLITNTEKDSEAIGSVMDVILGVAEQTNLLALNAAIEAARAGEHGRGFAVVADEVRTLASRTQESSSEIQEMILKLQTSSRAAVEAMEEGKSKARLSVEQATKAGEALELIDNSVNSIHGLNTQIASAAEEQSSVSVEIDKNISKINQMAEHASDGASQTAVASDQLAQLAGHLQELVQQFRV